jgi:hypothetical protein
LAVYLAGQGFAVAQDGYFEQVTVLEVVEGATVGGCSVGIDGRSAYFGDEIAGLDAGLSGGAVGGDGKYK